MSQEKGQDYGSTGQPQYPQPSYTQAGGPPNEAPPQYEPPKDGQYPPPQQGAYSPPQQGAYPPPQQGAYPPQGGYPPQGYGYPGGYQGTPVMAQPVTTTTVLKLNLGANPQPMQCQFCQAQVVTAVRYENGLLTWLAVGGMCLIGCWLGCQFIPLCINDLKDVEHVCPNCQRIVGRYERIK